VPLSWPIRSSDREKAHAPSGEIRPSGQGGPSPEYHAATTSDWRSNRRLIQPKPKNHTHAITGKIRPSAHHPSGPNDQASPSPAIEQSVTDEMLNSIA
jgi:hypothetical protein